MWAPPSRRASPWAPRSSAPSITALSSLETGAHDEGPLFDGLHVYSIQERDGNLHISVPKDKLKKGRVMNMVLRDPENKQRYVIIGAGAAGLSAAETLRQAG